MSTNSNNDANRENHPGMKVDYLVFNDDAASSATQLKSYEEGSFTCNTTGAAVIGTANSGSGVTFTFTKIGRNVTIKFPSTTGTGVATTPLTLNGPSNTNCLPAQIRPSADTTAVMQIVNNNAVTQGIITLPASAATPPSIALLAGGNFTVTQPAGFTVTCVQYSIA